VLQDTLALMREVDKKMIEEIQRLSGQSWSCRSEENVKQIVKARNLLQESMSELLVVQPRL